MVTGAVICEFNPFHNGHKYLLDEMKRDGCDCIVAVMSTSFTQRGDVAVYSKFTRAEDSLKGGADIVIELPVVWAVSSAQRFAKAGCEIIKALGCVDRVYFGSECGDIEILKSTAEATTNPQVLSITQNLMTNGEYYPAALERAVAEVFGNEISQIISHPNNTLGLEYIKSLADSNIELRTIQRKGADHDSEDVVDNIASASRIREDILAEKVTSLLLPQSNTNCDNPAFYTYGERAVLYALRNMSAEDFEALPDVSEGLHNRIYETVCRHNSIDEILTEIKTKRYTLARLRRILTCALLGITKEHQIMQVPYIRVLGFSSCGELLLKKAKATASLPLVVNFAKDYQLLDENAKQIAELEINATNLRTVFEKSPTECNQDFTQGIIKT